MNNKKVKITIMSMIIIVLLSLLCVQAAQTNFFAEWGKDLKNHRDNRKVINKYGDFKVARKGIYSSEKTKLSEIKEIGRDVIVTDEQINIAKDFYIESGKSKTQSEKEALEYVEKENALYAEAIKNGFDVTREDVEKYIEELKIIFEKSENKEDNKKMIESFGSKEEYWQYEKTIYKKLLPIQNYLDYLKRAYVKKYSSKYDMDKVFEMWAEELERVKEDAVKKQSYSAVDDNTKISELDEYSVK